MVLSCYFPTALRIVDALQPVYETSPNKVKKVAELVEETLQAYGRCLLAASRHSGNEHLDATVSSEAYRIWRSRLMSAFQEIETDLDPDQCGALANAKQAARDLMWTIDKVLSLKNIRCSVVSSGLQA